MLAAAAALGAAVAGCDLVGRTPDTAGLQEAARWVWHGRLALEADDSLTVTRIRVDSGLAERHDVVLARYDFDPLPGMGDEYSLTLGLDLGDARGLPLRTPLALGPPPLDIPAVAIVACLCRPLRPDSVRGTLTIRQRGMRQLTMYVDARLYFTAWHDSTVHARYELRQPLYGVR